MPPEVEPLLHGAPQRLLLLLGRETVPILHIFGISATGNSVLINVFGFFPYLYFQCPEGLVGNLDLLTQSLDVGPI